MSDCFTTMITPYRADGSVDYETAEKYVRWYYDAGLTGIFSVCQSSEIFYLSLEERIRLNSCVYTAAKKLEKKGNSKFTVVSSGHVSDSIKDQIRELNNIYNSGTDSIIMITNRLDPQNKGDDEFIRNAEKIVVSLPAEAKLGLYECPYPYKRLVTPRILEWCKSVGRFAYIKDTCCDADVIADRCRQLNGSGFKLLNANCQTLLESLRRGADGYSGIMCNFHPKLYAWLCKNFDKYPEKAGLIQSFTGNMGFTECLSYPLTAKYHFNLCGIKTEIIARNRNTEELTEYQKDCMRQMKYSTDFLETLIN